MQRVNDESERAQGTFACLPLEPSGPPTLTANIPQSLFKHHHFFFFPPIVAFICALRPPFVWAWKCTEWNGLAHRNLLQRSGNHVLMRGSWSMKRTNELQPTNSTTESNRVARIMPFWHCFQLADGVRMLFGWRKKNKIYGKLMCVAWHGKDIFWLLKIFRTTAVIT